MICLKCGFGYMVDDSHRDIKSLKCWVCGERIYPGYPKRSGALVCSRCGEEMDEKNASSLCKNCLRNIDMHAERLRGRNYGETICVCGATFTKKSPTQHFHSRECRKLVTA